VWHVSKGDRFPEFRDGRTRAFLPAEPEREINSRSKHPGGVDVLLGDGSVRVPKGTINGFT
jgi:prepilin-type processing-associated H-X9-DG protein